MKYGQRLIAAAGPAISWVSMPCGRAAEAEDLELPTLTELEARLDAARKALETRSDAGYAGGAPSGESGDAGGDAPIPIVHGARGAQPLDSNGGKIDVPMVSVATQPRYPPAKLRRGIQGGLMLRVPVEANGRISKVEVEKTSGYEDFDRSAIESVAN